MGVKLSIIVPCYNEEKNLVPLLKRLEDTLKKIGSLYEIILIDDGSQDNTKEVIKRLSKENKNIIPKFHEKNLGIVGAWKTGLQLSSGEYIVTIDADLQYRPEDIELLYKEMENGDFDLVQGWRAFHVKQNYFRGFLSKYFSLLLNFLFSMNLNDIKSGFIIYKRACFDDILSYKYNYYYFQHFITISAYYKGYKIKQIPITFDKRYYGESFIKIPLLFSMKALLDLPKALIEFRLKRRKKS